MEKLRDSKGLYVILSVLIAAALWIYVGKEADPVKVQSYSNIPVTFTGADRLAEQELTLSSGAQQAISLRLQARSSILRELAREGKIEVTVSLSSITRPGEYTLDYNCDFKISMIGGTSSSIEILERSPQGVKITVSRQQERSVAVRGSFTGSVSEGYQIGEFSIAPSSIQISGTEEAVSQISYAQVTLNQSHLSETFTGEMPFVLYDYENNPVDSAGAGILTDVSTVQVTLPVVRLKEVPLRVQVQPGGGATAENAKVTIEPESIMIAGSRAELDAIQEITLLGVIDLSQIYTSEDYTFDIPLPPELENVSGLTRASVHVEITGLATRNIDVANIQIINVPDGYTAVPVTQSRQVQIRGPEEAVNAVLDTQLLILVDWNDISSPQALGNQSVPAKVRLSGSSEVGVVGDAYSISVAISRT